ncbi:MAG: hypothetical protein FJ083_15530 [Cyanobacteria bacterium K_Offshore_surface_m2_239]|nr:hypothetical protein [Cyanobacteria bacterium K_Offshore_surface_m2_239]
MERNSKNKHVLSLLAVMAASSGTVFTAGAAEAGLVFEFWQQYSDVKLKVTGSLSAPSAGLATNNFSDLLNSSQAFISTGSFATGTNFTLDSGADSFGSLDDYVNLSSYVGNKVFLRGSTQSLMVDNYSPGATISGLGTFNQNTLSGLGLSSTPGLLASWTIAGSSETVDVKVGQPLLGDGDLVVGFSQNGADVQMTVSGRINMPATSLATNGFSPLVNPGQAMISAGYFNNGSNFPLLSGPRSFGSLDEFIDLSSYSGQRVFLQGSQSLFIDNFVSGATIAGSAVIANQSLAELGLSTTPGILASWPISSSTGTVSVKVLAPVPGPLPVLGAGAAFGFCRRLRQRINAA